MIKTENALIHIREILYLYEDLRLASLANNEMLMKACNRALESLLFSIGTDTLRHIETVLENRWVIEIKEELEEERRNA